MTVQRNFYYWIIYGLIADDLVWVRLRWGGSGLCIKRTRKMFSEREGYVKSIPLPRGWRVSILKASK